MPLLSKVKHLMMSQSRSEKLNLFLKDVCTSDSNTVLDVGPTDVEYSLFDNFIEKHYPHPEKITVLSVLPLVHFSLRYPEVKTFVFQGGTFPFADNSFDVVHSNAVIEHVGGKDKQVEFVKELSRVGRKVFFTTPSRLFPFETHTNVPFLHYLPKHIFNSFLRFIGKEWATGDYMNLLSRRDLEIIVRLAGVNNFRIITKRMLGLPLHYIIISEKE